MSEKSSTFICDKISYSKIDSSTDLSLATSSTQQRARRTRRDICSRRGGCGNCVADKTF